MTLQRQSILALRGSARRTLQTIVDEIRNMRRERHDRAEAAELKRRSNDLARTLLRRFVTAEQKAAEFKARLEKMGLRPETRNGNPNGTPYLTLAYDVARPIHQTVMQRDKELMDAAEAAFREFAAALEKAAPAEASAWLADFEERIRAIQTELRK